MSDQSRTRVARTMALIGITGGLMGPIALLTGGNRSLVSVAAGFAALAIGFGVLAWIVSPAQPQNRAVWALTWASPLWAIQQILFVLRGLADAVPENLDELAQLSPADLPLWAAVLLWPGRWTWAPAYFAPLTFAILLFPDGRLPSRRWRLVGWFSALSMAAIALPGMVLYFPTSDLRSDSGVGAALDTISGVGFLLGGLAGLLCWVGLFVRYRHSPPEVRTQIRFVVFGTLVFGTTLAVSQLLDFVVGGSIDGRGAGIDTMADELLQLLALVVFLGAYAVAIMKFRLYDLDVIVSKGSVYLSLALFITGVYATLVVGIGTLFGGQSNPVTSIAAATVVAIAFQPARRFLERIANRVIFGHRATPYDVLSSFSRRAVTSDSDVLVARIPALVVDGTSASQVTLWVRSVDGFRSASSWPEPVDVHYPLSEPFAVHGADRSIPIVHDGELLGGLSLMIGRGEAITPPEEALLGDLTAGLGLVLRNGEMTADLTRQVAELEASRQRIMVAADDARRSLESDLGRGPLQQLLAFKAALASTGNLAGQGSSDQLTSLLDRLQTDADIAISTVKDFARGVYPPLLEAEGLTAALAEQAANTPTATSLKSAGVGRYPREVEAAVYFAVLEALQNTSKHANASSTVVTLTDTHGKLEFTVSDNGHGFDPAATAVGTGLNGLRDRLDSIGGQIRIDSLVGDGTTVSGFVPA